MNKYFTLWMRNFALALQAEMIYKVNFFVKILALMLANIIGPLITLLIYSNSAGIPGWTLQEFILFQGSFILVFGIGRTVFYLLPNLCIHAIRDGSFDKYLIKPFNTLLQLTLSSWIVDGIAEIFTGLFIVIWMIIELQISAWLVLAYFAVVLIAILFIYALMVLIASLAFLVVQSFALYDIFFRLSDFGRYPLDIYSGVLRFFLIFVFPIGVVAFYPVRILLGNFEPISLLYMILPVSAIFALSLFLWNLAMKRYTSAGG